MFVDIEKQDILVVGAGIVACRKIEQLVKFNPKITVIAPSVHPDIVELSRHYDIVITKRCYTLEDCENRFLVIGALDDMEEQRRIYDTCIKLKTPVNCVDSPSFCSFIFPALIVDKALCVGINTSGQAPAVSSGLRQYFTKLIPDGIDQLIHEVHTIRQNEPIGRERQDKIIGMCRAFFNLND